MKLNKWLVDWGKYAPIGNRGFFLSRVTDFGFSDKVFDLPAYFKERNQETLIFP